MAQEDKHRQRYLHALGVSLWIRREPAQRSAGVDASERSRAHATDAWSQLRAEVTPCRGCDLHRTRTQTVLGVGDANARWMVIGEAPGYEEDRIGEPFVGRAGQLLNAMLQAVGLRRGEVYIANVVKCRPPGNRDPRPEEIACCGGYLHRQISLVSPRMILAMGRIAAQSLLNTAAPLSRLRGRPHPFSDGKVRVVVTYHPAYLLRSPLQKRRAWEDLVLARSLVEGDC